MHWRRRDYCVHVAQVHRRSRRRRRWRRPGDGGGGFGGVRDTLVHAGPRWRRGGADDGGRVHPSALLSYSRLPNNGRICRRVHGRSLAVATTPAPALAFDDVALAAAGACPRQSPRQAPPSGAVVTPIRSRDSRPPPPPSGSKPALGSAAAPPAAAPAAAPPGGAVARGGGRPRCRRGVAIHSAHDAALGVGPQRTRAPQVGRALAGRAAEPRRRDCRLCRSWRAPGQPAARCRSTSAASARRRRKVLSTTNCEDVPVRGGNGGAAPPSRSDPHPVTTPTMHT